MLRHSVCFSLCVDRWFRQHEYIEKLNMQAILNASAMHDEFVKEHLVSHGKVTTTSQAPSHSHFIVPRI